MQTFKIEIHSPNVHTIQRTGWRAALAAVRGARRAGWASRVGWIHRGVVACWARKHEGKCLGCEHLQLRAGAHTPECRERASAPLHAGARSMWGDHVPSSYSDG